MEKTIDAAPLRPTHDINSFSLVLNSNLLSTKKTDIGLAIKIITREITTDFPITLGSSMGLDKSPKIKNKFNNQYANAIYYSQNETYKFIEWIKQQPFYENTTIVIIGDHLSMCSDFFKNKNGNRTQYNLILNPSPDLKYSKDCLKNRTWSNYDMYPTVLAAMGVKIEGNRLGLGTDLFSNEPTVFEEFGYDYVNKELAKKSEFYNKRILSPNGEKIAMHNTDDNQKYA